MAKPRSSKSEELRRRWDRVFSTSLVVSLVLHIVLLLMFRETQPLPETPLAAAGPSAGDPEAAAGGGMEMIELRIETPPPAPEEEVTPPEPVPVPDAPQPQVEPQEERRTPSRDQGRTATGGEGRGEETGPGRETGTGSGDAGTGDEGLNRETAPSPRGLILPPSDRPRSVQGKTVTVYVFVNERGTVVSDSTRLSPSTGDRKFDSRLKQQAAEWKFRPGTRGGEPIAAWFPYTITF